jgi:hypothetical protein
LWRTGGSDNLVGVKDDSERRPGRRAFVARLGAVAASAGLPLTLAGPVAAVDDASPREPDVLHPDVDVQTDNRPEASVAHDDVPTPADDATRAFLGPLRPGAELGAFRIAATHAPFRGALPLLLELDGEHVQLDVLTMGAGPSPLASGHGLAIYGCAPARMPPRQVGEAAARALAALVPTADRAASLGLLTFEERAQRHPHEVYSVIPS